MKIEAAWPQDERQARKMRLRNFNRARKQLHRCLRALERFRYEVRYAPHDPDSKSTLQLAVIDDRRHAEDFDKLWSLYNEADAELAEVMKALTPEDYRHIVWDMVHTEVLNGAPYAVDVI